MIILRCVKLTIADAALFHHIILMKLHSYRRFKQEESDYWRSGWRCRYCFDYRSFAFMVSDLSVIKKGKAGFYR